MGNLPKSQSPPDRFLQRLDSIELQLTAPESLCNQSVWDDLSQCIWEKCVERQQTKETYRNKMLLWLYLIDSIEVVDSFSRLLFVPEFTLTLNEFRFFFCSIFSSNLTLCGTVFIWWAQRYQDSVWIRPMWICVWCHVASAIWMRAVRPWCTYRNWANICNN